MTWVLDPRFRVNAVGHDPWGCFDTILNKTLMGDFGIVDLEWIGMVFQETI